MTNIRILLICLAVATLFGLPHNAFAAATDTTVTSLMTVLAEEKNDSVFNVDLNAPFAKETCGVREQINPETGELTIYSSLLNIPGRNGMDLDLALRYSSRSAGLFDERTKCADTLNGYGQSIVALYDVFDSSGFWLRTDALLYLPLDMISSSVAMGSETWIFTGNLQYQSGTTLITAANIMNYASAQSFADESSYIFGQGWSLDLPSLYVNGDMVYVTLKDGQTYEAEFGKGSGLKDCELTSGTLSLFRSQNY